jgi:hypothetical protein
MARSISLRVQSASETRWATTGTVTAIDGTILTVTIDGTSTGGLHHLGGYVPVVGDVVLIAIVRGTASVSYIVVGKILA